MSEVGRSSTGGVQLDECVSYDVASDTWTLKREPDFIARGIEEGVINEEEVARWRHMLA